MMLERRQDNLVALLQADGGENAGDEIDSLGRAADEDNVAGGPGSDESLDLAAGALIGFCRPGGEGVGTAVNVRVVAFIEPRDRVDHRLRFLRRRRVVEPGERPPIDRLVQNREVTSNEAHIQRPAGIGTGRRMQRFANRAQPGIVLSKIGFGMDVSHPHARHEPFEAVVRRDIRRRARGREGGGGRLAGGG